MSKIRYVEIRRNFITVSFDAWELELGRKSKTITSPKLLNPMATPLLSRNYSKYTFLATIINWRLGWSSFVWGNNLGNHLCAGNISVSLLRAYLYLWVDIPAPHSCCLLSPTRACFRSAHFSTQFVQPHVLKLMCIQFLGLFQTLYQVLIEFVAGRMS